MLAPIDSDPPVAVSLLALPESTPAALHGLYEVLSSVGVAWAEATGEPPGQRKIDTRIVGPQREPFASAVGIPIAPHAALTEAGAADIVIVTDLSLPSGSDPRGRWPAACEWVRQRFAQGATVCSVCTGSVFLADSGLLDGEDATTHWAAARMFETLYPAVRLRPERILVPAGPDHRIITSGGSASWEDLALYLIARFCGETEAIRTAKLFLLGDRSEGQLPYCAMAQRRHHGDAVIADCQTWIADHYAAAHPVARMIARSGLTERTFARRFKAATGYAPVDYVQTLRLEEAKQLLETTDEPTDAVAHHVGYDDPAFFRRLFKRRTGTTPARYRQRFQAIGRLHRRA